MTIGHLQFNMSSFKIISISSLTPTPGPKSYRSCSFIQKSIICGKAFLDNVRSVHGTGSIISSKILLWNTSLSSSGMDIVTRPEPALKALLLSSMLRLFFLLIRQLQEHARIFLCENMQVLVEQVNMQNFSIIVVFIESDFISSSGNPISSINSLPV